MELKPAYNETVKDAIFKLVDAFRTINRVSKTASGTTKMAVKAIRDYDNAKSDLIAVSLEAYRDYLTLFRLLPGTSGIDFFA